MTASSPSSPRIRWSVVRWFMALAFAVVALHGTAAAQKATQFEIEESLTCQCGCGLTVHSCNHLNCSSGEPIKKEIAERLARGEDKATILAAFQAKFGEKILSAPVPHGFNILAWVLPGTAVVLGGLVLAIVIRRRAAETAPTLATPAPTPEQSALRARLDDELRRFDEDG